MSLEVSFVVWNWSKQKGAKLLLLVCIADYANAERIAWPSVASLGRRCRMSSRYVQRMLREIEADGELEIVKRTNNSNVYRVRITRPDHGVVTDELPFAPPDRPPAPGSPDPLNPVPPKPSREPSIKDPVPPAAKIEASKEAKEFVTWFLTLLQHTGAKAIRTTESSELSWAVCYDRLVGIDARPPAEVRAVCEWARRDDFWRSNFLSPMKLRDKKQGVSYYDRFLTKMNEPKNASPKNTSRSFSGSNPNAFDDYEKQLAAKH